MDQKQVAATNRVLKKLSALRQTLSDDERLILDKIVSRPLEFDVEAHTLRPDLAPAPAPAPAPKDVEAHAMKKSFNQIIFDKKSQTYKLIDL